jgi:hypothetical protein
MIQMIGKPKAYYSVSGENMKCIQIMAKKHQQNRRFGGVEINEKIKLKLLLED